MGGDEAGDPTSTRLPLSSIETRQSLHNQQTATRSTSRLVPPTFLTRHTDDQQRPRPKYLRRGRINPPPSPILGRPDEVQPALAPGSLLVSPAFDLQGQPTVPKSKYQHRWWRQLDQAESRGSREFPIVTAHWDQSFNIQCFAHRYLLDCWRQERRNLTTFLPPRCPQRLLRISLRETSNQAKPSMGRV